jgi:hypothetical protein
MEQTSETIKIVSADEKIDLNDDDPSVFNLSKSLAYIKIGMSNKTQEPKAAESQEPKAAESQEPKAAESQEPKAAESQEPKAAEVKLTKKERKNMTMYWAVELDNSVFDNEEIKIFLDEHPNLIKLSKIHSTLLFVGKKINKDEEIFLSFVGKECCVTIDSFGHSDNAMALNVKSMTCDNIDVPSFATRQHVTMALKEGVSAKDSVNTLLGDGTVKLLSTNITIMCNVKRYMY